MKTIKYLFQLVLISLVLGGATSCARDFEEPPLIAPEFTPNEKSVFFTIEDLKAKYKDVTDPVLIDMDIHLKAQVVGNDISGNIFKQLYIQDATGGIQLGVDQNNVATVYGVGQEVYVMLHGVYILKYGGEFQLGFKGTNANRIPWEKFKEFVRKNGFAKPSNVTPKVVDISYLHAESTPAADLNKLVNTLVRFEKMHFVNGGPDSLFIRVSGGTTSDEIRDPNGKSVIMRTSSYATPFVGKYLPYGNGKVTGILGRHNGGWQFMVRDLNDVKDSDFDGKTPEVAPKPEGEVFSETFGKDIVASATKIADFKEWDNKAPINYTDPLGVADIRTLKSGANLTNHVFLTANRDASLVIKGINTKDQNKLTLSYDLAAGVYDTGATTNLNLLQIKVDGVVVPVPSKVVTVVESTDRNKFYTIVLDAYDFPAKENITLEFFAPGTDNKFGFRLDNIKIAKKQDVIIPQ